MVEPKWIVIHGGIRYGFWTAYHAEQYMRALRLNKTPFILEEKAPVKRLDKFVRTSENWCGSFAPKASGNTLGFPAVKVSALRLSSGDWRVCLWGNDDLGMELDGHTQAEAKALFDSIPDFITMAQLREKGFVPA